jgi:threonine dehydrogenase-like Zn-dependent dehydrogenase
MIAAGLCGTDIQIAAGVRPDRASVLGHEGVGLLREDGRPARLVVFNPVDPEDPEVILGHSFDGIFRSLLPLAELPPWTLLEVPALDPTWLLALCEPLACVLYSWELIGPLPAPARIGVWGAGPIGLMQALAGLQAGHRVSLVHRSQSRRRWLEEELSFGRDLLCRGEGRQPTQLDVAILCVPRPAMASAVQEATAALVPEGLLVLVTALEQDAAAATFAEAGIGRVRARNQCGRIDPEQGTIRSLTRTGKPVHVTGHRGASLDQLTAAAERLGRDPATYGALVTHRVAPGEAVELINARCAGHSRDRRGRELVKVLVELGPDLGL